QAQKRLAQSERLFREEESKADKRKKLKRDIERMTDMLPVVQELDNKKAKMAELKKNGEYKTSQQTKLKEQIAANDTLIEKMRTEINEKEKSLLTRGEKEARHIELQNQYKVFALYNQLKEKVFRLEKELTEKQKVRTQAEKHYKVY